MCVYLFVIAVQDERRRKILFLDPRASCINASIARSPRVSSCGSFSCHRFTAAEQTTISIILESQATAY